VACSFEGGGSWGNHGFPARGGGSLLRASELRELSDEELAKRLAESRENLFNLRFQLATGALDNTARLGLAKRDIARIMTIQAERENTLERR
jgi:large subunit ribosomal protein L29